MQFRYYFLFVLIFSSFCYKAISQEKEENKRIFMEGKFVADITQRSARWISRDSLVWQPKSGIEQKAIFKLYSHPAGKIGFQGKRMMLGEKGNVEILTWQGKVGDAKDSIYDKKLPYLSYLHGRPRFSTSSLLDKIPGLVKENLVVAMENPEGDILDASGVQIAGVLDDLYAYHGKLGISWENQKPVFRLWSPVAFSVKLHIYETPDAEHPKTSWDMVCSPEEGIWKAEGDSGWKNLFYLYEVRVFVPSIGKIASNIVTDPYSISLSKNSKKSQIADLSDNSLKPQEWDKLQKPPLRCFSDIVLYELHIRDFSIYDSNIKEEERGTFAAFYNPQSQGAAHLKKLAKAGISHIHLLPCFDIATIEEDRPLQKNPAIPDMLEPDSEIPQKIVSQSKDKDGFNWGYDPYHYMAAEGSYSTNPEGNTRILEFRKMVQNLNEIGLRVIMDVVFNHTHSAGQHEKSVLDRIVPGYYYRLDEEGNIPCSSCCPDLATEHTMMEKLMIDALVLWAKEYKVDGFRFDLMGHHTTSNMRKIKEALSTLNIEEHGVDGKKIYLYGEAWEFGSLNAMIPGEACHQKNTYSLGIGSFNDRIRDAIRGGSPFSDLAAQGFCNGLYYDFNHAPENREIPEDKGIQKKILLNLMDNIRIGMAGNLREYQFIDSEGRQTAGKDVLYRGNPGAGYSASPEECINYVSVHDNHTLWDNIQAKAPFHTPGRNPQTATIEERVRMNHIALSIIALAQGIPFFHAGDEILRSKSGDKDSYNSGDHFNRLDFTYKSNNWGAGLPIAEKNQYDWPFWKQRLCQPELKAQTKNIQYALECFCELLEIRKSSPLFRLPNAKEIQKRVVFLNAETGKEQIPGLIVMSLLDNFDQESPIDSQYKRIVCAINATQSEISFSHDSLKTIRLCLHPVLQKSQDSTIQKAFFESTTGTLGIPAQSTIVFCEIR